MQTPSTKLRLDTFAHISTAHVTPEVGRVLDLTEYEASPDWRDGLSLMKREYGWFIYVPDPDLDHISPADYASIPECLRACFDLAREEGASWILFDRDEEEVEALPSYEWQ
jgi:hypothetical protein